MNRAREQTTGLRVIRTNDDLHRATTPPPFVFPSLPIPQGIREAAYASTGSQRPITVSCDGRRWRVTAEEGQAFAGWIDSQMNRAALEAMPKPKRGRGPKETIDWWGLLLRLMPAVERGEPLDEALDKLRQRYGIQSLSQAHLWIKAQRRASNARLREMDRRHITGNCPDYEREFHARFVRLFPPRRPGRPPARRIRTAFRGS